MNKHAQPTRDTPYSPQAPHTRTPHTHTPTTTRTHTLIQIHLGLDPRTKPTFMCIVRCDQKLCYCLSGSTYSPNTHPYTKTHVRAGSHTHPHTQILHTTCPHSPHRIIIIIIIIVGRGVAGLCLEQGAHNYSCLHVKNY